MGRNNRTFTIANREFGQKGQERFDMIDVFAWYNVLFLIPLVFGLLMILGSALGAFGHGDVSHDIGHDLGHDVGHDAGHDAGHDSDNDGRQGHAGPLDLSGEAAHGIFSWALSFLGVGRVPFSIIIMVLALLFGGTGMSANYLLMPLIRTLSIFALISIGAACFVTFFLTGVIARLVNRWMPSTESYNVTMGSLIGRSGKIFIAAAGSEAGFADVVDRYKGIQRIPCRCLGGVLQIGTEIVVTDREEDGTFVVEPLRG